MKISKECPTLIYTRCKEQFGADWDKGVIITYGDTIYTKSGHISPDLVVHEMTHIEQQNKVGPDIWWDKYFSDKDFRLSQEVEAYSNQAKFIKENVKDRNKRFSMVNHIWKMMATMYDGMISYEKAKLLIPLY